MNSIEISEDTNVIQAVIVGIAADNQHNTLNLNDILEKWIPITCLMIWRNINH